MLRKNIYLREQDNPRNKNRQIEQKQSHSPSLSSLASAKYHKFSPSNFRKEEPKGLFNFFFEPEKQDDKIFTLDSIQCARSQEKKQKQKTGRNICAVSKYALEKVQSEKNLLAFQDQQSQGSVQRSSRRLVFISKDKSEKSVKSKTQINDHKDDRQGILFQTFNPNQIKKMSTVNLCEQIQNLAEKTQKQINTIKFRFVSDIDDKICQEIDHPKLKKVIQDLHKAQKIRINEIFSSIKDLFSKFEEYILKTVKQSTKISSLQTNLESTNIRNYNQNNTSLIEQPSFEMEQEKKLKEFRLREPVTLKNLYSFKNNNEENSTSQTREHDRVIEDLPKKSIARSQSNEYGFSIDNSRVQSQMHNIYYQRKDQKNFDSYSDNQGISSSNKSLRSYKKLTMKQIKEKTEGFEAAMKKIKEMILQK